MPNIENLKKRAKLLVRQHRERYHPVAAQLRRLLPQFAGLTDREILDAPFALADAQQAVARDAGYEGWAAAQRDRTNGERPAPHQPAPRLAAAQPQLFVADVKRAAEFYVERLGFRVAYLYGEPPFYGLVVRGGAGLNLRHVDAPVVDAGLREREILLGAQIPVDGVKELFLEFRDRGVEFAQTLKPQPWGASDFIVRDPDGNLVCFASAIGEG
jgi:catechol 2,3-dioxygenase-like lactoylglutathione lyase family enzyme